MIHHCIRYSVDADCPAMVDKTESTDSQRAQTNLFLSEIQPKAQTTVIYERAT